MNNILVKAHHSIRLVKRYYGPFLHIYIIIIVKLLEIKPKLALQLLFMVINDLVIPNDLVLTFLVFDAYPYMTNINAISANITQRSIAMRKAMKKLKRSDISCQVNDILNT